MKNVRVILSSVLLMVSMAFFGWADDVSPDTVEEIMKRVVHDKEIQESFRAWWRAN